MANIFGDASGKNSMFGTSDPKEWNFWKPPSPLTADVSPKQYEQSVSDNTIQQNSAVAQAGLDSLNLSKAAAASSAALANQNYQAKNSADITKAIQLRDIANNSSGFSESFGLGASAPSGYTTDYLGRKGLYNASDVSNWQQRQNNVLSDQIRQAQQLSNVDLQKQSELNQQQQRLGTDTMNRQAAITSQGDANNFLRQKQLNAQQIAGQQSIASIQAQGNILGSLFGSLGAGSQNYRYWS